MVTLDVYNTFNTTSWMLIPPTLPTLFLTIFVTGIQITKETCNKYRSPTRPSPASYTLEHFVQCFWNQLKGWSKNNRICWWSGIMAADDKDTLICDVNENLKITGKWMKENKLKLAPEKNEAFILHRKWKRENITFTIESARIVQNRVSNILGSLIPMAVTRYT